MSSGAHRLSDNETNSSRSMPYASRKQETSTVCPLHVRLEKQSKYETGNVISQQLSGKYIERNHIFAGYSMNGSQK